MGSVALGALKGRSGHSVLDWLRSRPGIGRPRGKIALAEFELQRVGVDHSDDFPAVYAALNNEFVRKIIDLAEQISLAVAHVAHFGGHSSSITHRSEVVKR